MDVKILITYLTLISGMTLCIESIFVLGFSSIIKIIILSLITALIITFVGDIFYTSKK